MIPSTRKQYYRLYNFSGDNIYANNENTPKNHKICDDQVIDLLAHSIKIVSLIIISLILMYCVPLFNILIRNQYDVIIPIILPFIDPQTKTGFYANLVNQLTFCFYGLVAITGIEMITCMLKNTILATSAIIDNELYEFEKLLKFKHDTFSPRLTWQFRNILVKIIDFNRLITNLTDLYYWKFLVQPGFMVYTVSASIFLFLKVCIYYVLILFGIVINFSLCTIKDDWGAGPGSAVCCYIQLFILCDVGAKVNDAVILG